MKTSIVVLLLATVALHAQVPQLVNYQGRVAVGTTNFSGSGQFKFALVNATGSTTYWSNDGTSVAGSPPAAVVTLTVTNGLYSVLLGDTSLANMIAIPTGVFANADVRLRVWFNDGVNGSQLLAPDQRLSPNGYLPDGAVSAAKLANGSITSAKMAAGTAVPSQTVAGTAQTAVANTSYLATNASPTTFTLPTTANVGDVVQIAGAGAGGWFVLPGSGQGLLAPWVPWESNRSWTSVASSADGTKLVAVNKNNGQIYTSTDSGVIWTPRESNRTWNSVASSADGIKLIAAVDGGQLYTSTNSGVIWTPRESNRTWNSVASSASTIRAALRSARRTSRAPASSDSTGGTPIIPVHRTEEHRANKLHP